VVVLVIDSREVSQKHPLLAFVHLASSDPFLTQQRSKLDNEDEDPRKPGAFLGAT
jgi:hypothetical protein